MANKKLYNNSDSLEISELAALNDDISNDLLEELQKKVMLDANNFSEQNSSNSEDDSTLFEEPIVSNEQDIIQQEPENDLLSEKTEEITQEEATDNNSDSSENNSVGETVEENTGEKTDKENSEKKESVKFDSSYDDNFIKKYKAKLQKQAQQGAASAEASSEITAESSENTEENTEESIEKITNGNITERLITKEQREYNDSLDFLDGNIKYSKYVIYIDPENVDFIDNLTVKERKNLINGILKQQNDISVDKQRFKVIQNIILHVIIAILTVTLSIPVIYHAVNASLEASINNYRRSQTNFQTLYKEKGKITNVNK